MNNSELNKLMQHLAKRVKPNYPFQNPYHWIYTEGDAYICLICDKDMNRFYQKDIDDHRIQHLKDSNLLPFV